MFEDLGIARRKHVRESWNTSRGVILVVTVMRGVGSMICLQIEQEISAQVFTGCYHGVDYGELRSTRCLSSRHGLFAKAHLASDGVTFELASSFGGFEGNQFLEMCQVCWRLDQLTFLILDWYWISNKFLGGELISVLKTTHPGLYNMSTLNIWSWNL